MSKKCGLIPAEIPENIYGHKKRLLWMMEMIAKNMPNKPKSGVKILEIGCGTGVMLSIPLASLGYDVTGIDTDEKSIEMAKSVNPYQNARFFFGEAAGIENRFDFVILSEVLEHLVAPEALLKVSHGLLQTQGILLITVPNGYGWFEFEQCLWDKLFVGELLKVTRIIWAIEELKLLIKKQVEYPYYQLFPTLPTYKGSL